MKTMNNMMKVGNSATPASTGVSGEALNKDPIHNLPTLPISLHPKSVIRVSLIALDYKGPPNIQMAVCVAWKPAQFRLPVFPFSLITTPVSFNNGQNIAVDDNGELFRGVSGPFTLSAGDGTFKSYPLEPIQAPRLAVPEKRQYNLVGGNTGTFIDKVDTWTWVINITAIEANLGRQLSDLEFRRSSILSNESFFIGGGAEDTDADVLDII